MGRRKRKKRRLDQIGQLDRLNQQKRVSLPEGATVLSRVVRTVQPGDIVGGQVVVELSGREGHWWQDPVGWYFYKIDHRSIYITEYMVEGKRRVITEWVLSPGVTANPCSRQTVLEVNTPRVVVGPKGIPGGTIIYPGQNSPKLGAATPASRGNWAQGRAVTTTPPRPTVTVSEVERVKPPFQIQALRSFILDGDSKFYRRLSILGAEMLVKAQPKFMEGALSNVKKLEPQASFPDRKYRVPDKILREWALALLQVRSEAECCYGRKEEGETVHWLAVVPKQEVSGASIDVEDWTPAQMYLVKRGYDVMGNIHTHPGGGTHASGTDKETWSEWGGIHLILGRGGEVGIYLSGGGDSFRISDQTWAYQLQIDQAVVAAKGKTRWPYAAPLMVGEDSKKNWKDLVSSRTFVQTETRVVTPYGAGSWHGHSYPHLTPNRTSVSPPGFKVDLPLEQSRTGGWYPPSETYVLPFDLRVEVQYGPGISRISGVNLPEGLGTITCQRKVFLEGEDIWLARASEKYPLSENYWGVGYNINTLTVSGGCTGMAFHTAMYYEVLLKVANLEPRGDTAHLRHLSKGLSAVGASFLQIGCDAVGALWELLYLVSTEVEMSKEEALNFLDEGYRWKPPAKLAHIQQSLEGLYSFHRPYCKLLTGTY